MERTSKENLLVEMTIKARCLNSTNDRFNETGRKDSKTGKELPNGKVG